MGVTPAEQAALDQLAAAIRNSGWDLALQVLDEGLRDDTIPSLGRLGRLGQLGDMPTFIAELAREVADPQPGRIRRGSPLAQLARDHAREREALGFAPREVVTEFLLLRRVLWRFVSQTGALHETSEFLLVEQRLNDTIDRLVTECVVAYFDRATSELADQARRDPLTGLLNHQAFTRELEDELARAGRYGHGLALVFFDLDDFKAVNDTWGHQEGDRVLRRIADALREVRRTTDIAGRMGGDEFAVLLLEADAEAGGLLLERLRDRCDELVELGELPVGVGISGGVAHRPNDGVTAEDLFRAADRGLYAAKRSR